MKKRICGIQQMGIGVPDVQNAWAWYRKNFGVDIRIFEEAAEAPLMIDYTGGVVQSRTATLALRMVVVDLKFGNLLLAPQKRPNLSCS